MSKPRTYPAREFLLMIQYEGPWERIANFCYGIRKDCTLRYVIPKDPRGWRRLAGWAGDKAEQRDRIWRTKYAVRRKTPHKRWERRGQ